MINARFVPIEKWPGVHRTSWKNSAFRVTTSRQLDKLEEELNKLGARDILVQCYLTRDDIRNDGWPRSGAKPPNPGIIISFTDRRGNELSFPCDTYFDWFDNLYAIALSLEALRAVDRYGVTKSAEQYQGWRRLEAPGTVDTRGWAYEQLARVADTSVESLKGDPQAVDAAYRAAVRKTHPDSGGNIEAFRLVTEAIRVIRASQ
jgi:hypothetical protein